MRIGWQAYLAVALGGALGSVFRLAVASWLEGVGAREGRLPLPIGTILVNVTGCFVMGLIAALSVAGSRYALHPLAQRFLLVGVLGGYTTFSSFSLQTYLLWEGGQRGDAFLNVAVSLTFCLAGAWLGSWVGAQLR